ncbi:Sir2 family NAD-dependent protein deacetylase [Trueperella bialowiezensis]|uniref:protein acetyllysine N-acetyltransferase n=1 Tax=Trueperella bialowiezensis TaxID=312285 RepID=A0A448PC84_9ACTO|nr:Sir2 family NAD-dependent protein deacetylase [Trueperella bialowiezensis]VEI12571.1 NAD-dependent deacetylase [Trueperella bialowiezensis]
MAHRIEDYFPSSHVPNLRVKNVEVPPASAAIPDPHDLAQALQPALDLLRGKKIAALTGAGLSTDSGLPDYRSPGSRKRNPITIQQFMAEERWRRHYWARNHQGWLGPRMAAPNAGHKALADLERRGILTGLITQNVDRLHTRAGSRRTVDLHGRFDEVVCTECNRVFTRDSLHKRLLAANPTWVSDAPENDAIAPDADATVENTQGFQVVGCERCGGILRTNVVFFGGTVRPEDVRAATDIIDEADALLVAGTSLPVQSALRLVRTAHRADKPIVIINRGHTKGDKYADVIVHAGTTESLSWLAEQL